MCTLLSTCTVDDYFTMATSPFPVRSQSDCVHICLSPIWVFFQPTLIRWTGKKLKWDSSKCERSRTDFGLEMDWLPWGGSRPLYKWTAVCTSKTKIEIKLTPHIAYSREVQSQVSLVWTQPKVRSQASLSPSPVWVRWCQRALSIRNLKVLRWLHTVSWKVENTCFKLKISYIDILLKEWN